MIRALRQVVLATWRAALTTWEGLAVKIIARGVATEYECRKLDAPAGCVRVLLVKLDGEAYEVFHDRAAGRSACECRGFQFRGVCKHVKEVASWI